MKRFLLLIAAAFLCLGAAKKPQVMIRYYGSGHANEGESFTTQVMVEGRPVLMSRAAIITEREIEAYYPDQARDGSMAVYFKLTPHGNMLVQEATLTKRGGILIPYLNGRQCQHMIIDRQITDGILAIPSGLSADDIALLDQKFRMMGQPKKKR